MAHIEIDIEDEGATAMFARLGALGADPSPLLEAWGNSLEKNVRMCFIRSTDPYGRPWSPLKVRDGKPLEDTGHLRDSFTHAVEADAVLVGTNAIQAAIQNFGGTIRPRDKKALRFMIGNVPVFAQSVTLPPRAMIPNAQEGLPKQWSEDLADVFRTVIESIAGGS